LSGKAVLHVDDGYSRIQMWNFLWFSPVRNMVFIYLPDSTNTEGSRGG